VNQPHGVEVLVAGVPAPAHLGERIGISQMASGSRPVVPITLELLPVQRHVKNMFAGDNYDFLMSG
jgi:hypothetical protein